MPKLDPKQVQRDLEKGTLWPVYWLYGGEGMKARELLKRIRLSALGEQAAAARTGFAEEVLDGMEVTGSQIVDSARTLALGGGLRFIVVRDAHAIDTPESMAELLAPAGPKAELGSVCVFLSKDLDGRKKFSKQLLEGAAVVHCEEVADEDRESWIGYLAKRRALEVAPEAMVRLRSLDPWSLDIVDGELEKLSLGGEGALLGGAGSQGGGDAFVEAFFGREGSRAMEQVTAFADSPEEALPLLGLIAWNARYLALVLADRERGTRTVKLSPFLADRFTRWGRKWTLPEAVRLQSALAELDFGIKQTFRLPMGLWSALVTEFCLK